MRGRLPIKARQSRAMNGTFRSWPGVRLLSTFSFPLSVSLLLSSVAVAPGALAQGAPDAFAGEFDGQPIVTVLATGSGVPIDRTGQPVTVITAQDIATIQGQDLTRVLERVPGLSITRNGGPGSFTGVRLRGADAEQVLVLVDGVRVEDVAAPSAGFDFGTLTPGGIAQIDVLRGSNSVVWGSAAIGGVIAITSEERSGVRAMAEYGANDTYTADASAGLASDRHAFALNGGYTRTDGISAAAAGTEPDSFRQWRIGGRGRLGLTDDLSLVATARFADSRTGIDGFGPPSFLVFGDTAEYQDTRQISGRVGARYETDAVTLAAGFAMADNRRQYFDPASGPGLSYEYKGRSERADLIGRVALPAGFALDFGADSEWTRFESTFDDRATANLTSGHALLGWDSGSAHVSAGVRVDDHSRFGTAWTIGANGSVNLLPALRLRASYGEGFKAPTLYQLLSDYGNAALVPERSKSYDAAVEFRSEAGTLGASATVFRRDSRNLIAFVSCASLGACATRPFGLYDNIGLARAQGVEFEAFARPVSTLRLGVVYTWLETENRTAGNANFGRDLPRRPQNTATVSADWTSPLAGLSLGADIRLVSDSFDNASNSVRLDGYYLATVRAALPLGERAELFGRVENLTDERYETVAGYGTWGRSAYIGIRALY